MSYWKTRSSIGGWIAIGLIAVILLSIIGLLFILASSPVGMVSFFSGVIILVGLGAIIVFAYWIYGYYTLYYTLDRDALRIHWAGFETIVPIATIRSTMQTDLGKGDVRLPFLRWPGYCIGSGSVSGIGSLVCHTIGSLDQQLLVLTDSGAYAISPEDPDGFLEALALRQSLGSVHDIKAGTTASHWVGLSFWSDRRAHSLLGLALALNLALFAYLCAVYANLMPVLAFHFNAAGDVDRVAPAVAVFFLPAIGVLSLLLNSLLGFVLHARHRLATLLLWGGTSVIQGYLWVAALGVTMRGMGT